MKAVLLLIGFVLASIHFAEAQQPGKSAEIGFLGGSSASVHSALLETFRRSLRELGYVEGKNIAIQYRYAEAKFERLPDLADELAGLKVDVLIASSTPAAIAAKNATSSIPIIFLSVSDPVSVRLVDSLARPGGNITGFTNIAPEVAGKRLELLKETVPKLSRVAVLWDPKAPGSTQQWKESQLPGRELGLQLHSMEVSSANEYDVAFNAATRTSSGGLAVTENPVAIFNQRQIADLAAKNRLPAIYPREDFVNSSGLMSYGFDLVGPYRRAAVYVDKILKGAKPSDLPVEQPTKFELVINLKTAKQIGLTIPPNVLARADRVIR